MNSEYLTDGGAEFVMTLFDDSFKGVCVDVGAFDPFWISNSYIFEEAGWDVYCIEPNPYCIPKLKKYRNNVYEYACGEENKDNEVFYIYNNPDMFPKHPHAGATGLIHHSSTDITTNINVNVRTLNWLMENLIKRNHIDFLSIDVEMYELPVLRGIDLFKYNPKVIEIENLWGDKEQQQYLEDAGYKHINRFVVNDIYIRSENV